MPCGFHSFTTFKPLILKELYKYGLGLIALVAFVLNANAQAVFVENQGQWQGDFSHRLEISGGAFFFSPQGYRALFFDLPHHHGGGKAQAFGPRPELKAAAYGLRFLGAQKQQQPALAGEKAHPRHYFLGSDPKAWRSGVASAAELHYSSIYPGIDLQFKGAGEDLKYDFIVAPGADAGQIVMEYEGLEALHLEGEVLHLRTAVGTLKEFIPRSYQVINGREREVKVRYRLEGKRVHFEVGRYNPRFPLVIDPQLNFASFSGSQDLNFGNSATYGENGTAYGAGVNFGPSYPTTLGSVQPQFASDSLFNVDISISKFSASGDRVLWASYLGGADIEVPHSLMSTEDGALVMVGNTGSADFPTTNRAFQDSFGGGSFQASLSFNDYDQGMDLFIAKIATDGDRLIASTFWGGSGNDGFNRDIYHNYGDHYRSEVLVLDNGDIAVSSQTFSDDLPQVPAGDLRAGTQNAFLGIFNSDLSQLRWGTYFGGSQATTGYSIRANDSLLYLTGSTKSMDLVDNFSGAYQSTNPGATSAYIAAFSLSDGSLSAFSYYGTAQRDQSFLLDIDDRGGVYIYGQSKGSITPSPGRYANLGSQQFVAKFKADLASLEWQTVIGSGQNKQDLVPSAFMVDRCQNIFLSGWNGGANTVGFPAQTNGNTLGLPLSADPWQSATNGSDFYFMILDREAQALRYSTYLGGPDNEHVDGGTSRFDKNGTVYQAVCSNCNNRGFPTTPGSYSPSSGSASCNMAVFKFSFNQVLEAQAQVNYTTEIDSLCDALVVNFENNSLNATNYQWFSDAGDSSNLSEPVFVFDRLGSYQVTMIAFDTICGISDTATMQIDHNQARLPQASFQADYQACDENGEVSFANQSFRAQHFVWDFGNGQSSNQAEPQHQFATPGNYRVQLIALDTVCQRADTLVREISFVDTIQEPRVKLALRPCARGLMRVEILHDRPWYQYQWEFEGRLFEGRDPDLSFEQPGFQNLRYIVEDSLCRRRYEKTIAVDIPVVERQVFIPTAFSPNGDGLNDLFHIEGEPCEGGEVFRIFNRWGSLVFETSQPYEVFWDGRFNGQEAQSGVYTYQLQGQQFTETGYLSLIR